MRKIKILLLLTLIATVFISGCKKKESFDPAKQLEIDEQLINDFITKNNIAAQELQSSGMYYQIIAPGAVNVTYTSSSKVTVKYVGRLLNGQVFDQSTTGVTFPLGNLIYGWQVGIPLIKPGGKIRLLIPSGYAYGSQAQNGIPANAVLDFEIELLGVTNN
ncbi:MAG: FKBP-type peptidyl-prolyl cis-trans isomerase [Pyrinomonadaceae bacterium]|nr:FKBP-type peptidyl-prolyl cis-trans isomerase [Sphingobacteriaceae bacterium]